VPRPLCAFPALCVRLIVAELYPNCIRGDAVDIEFSEEFKNQELEAKRAIEAQLQREVEVLDALSILLGLPASGTELLSFSGLLLSSYTVKKKYTYYKLTGLLTGENADLELWTVSRKGKPPKDWLVRRETRHLLNIRKDDKDTVGALLRKLQSRSRRAKALEKWLKEFELGE
jgi:hypothetical protein